MGADEAAVLEQLVDMDRYPLATPQAVAYKNAVSRARRELNAAGCSVVPDFIRPDVVDALKRECSSVAPSAYYDVETVNVYNTTADPALPDDHPRCIMMERGNAFVARDNIPSEFIISRLYTSPQVQQFIANCFGLVRIHELADPLAGLCLNVLTPGRSHPWHFDTNEFAVSMLTQEPEGGGTFEYCPDIRSAQSENFDDVRSVLHGGGKDMVRRLDLRPGDLQLFRGRYSLHRVGAVEGSTDRHSAIFAYTQRPGVIGSVARTRQLFGRVLPAHLEAEGRAVRADQLLD